MKVKVNLVLTAIILVAVGMLCIIYPEKSLGPLTWLMGALILVSGCFTIIFSIKAQKIIPNASSTTLLGVFQIMLGSLFIMNTFDMLKPDAIGVLFATWVMYEGLSLLISSFGYKRANFGHWWIMLLFGLFNVVMGYIALLNANTISTVLAVLVGIGIVADGVMRIVAFIAISRIEKKLKAATQFETAEVVEELPSQEEA